MSHFQYRQSSEIFKTVIPQTMKKKEGISALANLYLQVNILNREIDLIAKQIAILEGRMKRLAILSSKNVKEINQIRRKST